MSDEAEFAGQARRIQDALQDVGPPPADPDDEEDADIAGTAVLTRWLVITEWMATDGTRWIAKIRSESTSQWDADGMALYALRSS